MKPKLRQSKIVELVSRDGATTVEALAEIFDVSAETIRRDLGHLAETGAIQKVHGGARRLRLHAEGSFQERMFEQAEAKATIGKKLAALIEPGETLFMDTGTTTLACAEALTGIGRLTVITNSAGIAQILGRTATVFLLGGAYGASNAQTVGPMVIDQIRRFQADRAILTVAALDPDVGAMDADVDEAQVARAMMEYASSLNIVAHAAKFGRRAAFHLCALNEIDMLVCDQPPDARFEAALAAAGVDVR